MDIFARIASRVFGISLIALSVFVALETICRKAFNFSFKGVDELGGYILAIGAALSFTVALVDRAHVRIDVLHRRMGTSVKAVLDWVSAVSFALLGAFLVYVGWFVIADTLTYGSVAPTPWATPLIYPQAAWYGAFCLFALAAIVLALRATYLLTRGKLSQVSCDFDPKGAKEELQQELQSLQLR